MAFMQPENIASRNDVPERIQLVARHFRDALPDDVTVWLERTGDGEVAALRREFGVASAREDLGHCYLVVLDPTSGIAVVETPTIRQLRSKRSRSSAVQRDAVRTEISTRSESLRGAARQLSIDALPIRHVLALPTVARADVSRLGIQMPCLAEEDFRAESLALALRDAIGGAVLQLTNSEQAVSSPSSSVSSAQRKSSDSASAGTESRPRTVSCQQGTVKTHLTPAEVAAARAAVNPGIRIGNSPQSMFAMTESADEDIIRVLDREQEQAARRLSYGYRVIRGVAGSGKTLVLTHRVRYLARSFPQWRFLLTCYNIPLSGSLSRELRDLKNVDVLRINQLAHRVLERTGRRTDEEHRDFEARQREAAALTHKLRLEDRYDAVFVDEAQDLGAVGLDLAWAVLRPGRDHFVIAFDGAQRIYRGKRRWNPPGMTAQGRTMELKQNYRNTDEILDLALRTLGGTIQQVDEGELPDDLDVLVSPKAAVRRGPPPHVLVCDGLDAEVDAIAERVKQLRTNEVPRDDIVVLSGSSVVLDRVLERIGDQASMDARANRQRAASATNVIRVATLQLLKGLEYRHVVIGGANDIWVEDDDPAEQDRKRRRLLYVAMTRASETLTVTFSGEGIMNTVSHVPESR